MASPAKRLRACFRGRVQGVGFRFFCEKVARRHTVVGWVRNRRDGSVELEMQGSAAAVAAMLDEIRRDHPGEVGASEVGEIPPQAGESQFALRY